MLYEWFSGIDFAYPSAFVLMGLIPLMIWWYLKRQNRQSATVMVSSVYSFRGAGSWKTYTRHIPFIFRLLAIICIVIALARPQKRNDEQLISGEGVDIIICMDVSGSMLAQDFIPSRLDAMKQVAAEFVDKRPTDRIGLVIFAGESFTSSPITSDRNMLKAQIFAAQSGSLADGTAIGDGLATSVDRLKNSNSKSKVVILLTDGENQGGLIDPLTAKEIAKNVGIRVYTVGIGSEGYTSAPVQRGTDQVLQKQKVNIDEELLREIARETGGLYFRARDNSALRNIYTEIDKLEKSKIEISSLKRYTERFMPLAMAAALFLFLEFLLRFTVFRKFP